MSNEDQSNEQAPGREASALNALVSEPSIDWVADVTRMANRIKLNQLREKMNHKITEGDVWAVIGAVKELQQAH